MAAENIPDGDLVSAHRQAKKSLERARKTAILVPLTLLVALGAYLWWRIDDFCHKKAPEVLQKVASRSGEVVGPLTARASQAMLRLAPVYAGAIRKVMARDHETYMAIAQAQFFLFADYSNASKLRMLSRANSLLTRVLAEVEKELVPALSGGEKVIFEATVAQTIHERYRDEINNVWRSQLKCVDAVSQSLHTIAELHPEAAHFSPTYLMGIGLEYAGLKLEGIK